MNLMNATCPHCGACTNANSQLAGDAGKPQPGDLSICLYCSLPAVFGDGLALRLPTHEEYEDLAADPTVGTILQAIAQLLPARD